MDFLMVEGLKITEFQSGWGMTRRALNLTEQFKALLLN